MSHLGLILISPFYIHVQNMLLKEPFENLVKQDTEMVQDIRVSFRCCALIILPCRVVSCRVFSSIAVLRVCVAIPQ
jgi:hypothetical protein